MATSSFGESNLRATKGAGSVFNDRRGEPDFHHAQMDTGRYSFEAYGKTHSDALKALHKGFVNHLKQGGSSLAIWRAANGTGYEPTEYYGANVTPGYLGGAVRDMSSQLNGHPQPKY